jgi:Zn-finger nucleic acid-binding protein
VNCPIDGTTLQITDRSGIEIDYCPKCRGVWLDRGELDKIIERADDDYDERRESYRPEEREQYRPPDREYGRGHEGGQYRKKKKRSILEDLFDFG